MAVVAANTAVLFIELSPCLVNERKRARNAGPARKASPRLVAVTDGGPRDEESETKYPM